MNIEDSMDEKHLILEQYRIYSESKEKYIDRAFLINRLYVVLAGVLFLLMLFVKAVRPEYLAVLSGVEFLGIMLCIMWFSNQDSYSSIIKIKYNAVIERMEALLPASPNKDEYAELMAKRHNKHIILVKDVQKWFAVLVLMLFIANLLLDGTGLVLNLFFD